MVKKKGKSNRTTLKDKYTIQKRVIQTKRKRKKQAKKDAKNGVINHKEHKKKRDPGIPNSWPFKEELLKDIQRAREKQTQQQKSIREKRRAHLRQLKEHQDQGGSCRTVEELVARADRDRQQFDGGATTSSSNNNDEEPAKSDGRVAAGQQSRRAYLRELKKVVETADVLLQVVDCRDPIGTRIHKSLENVILSKSDKRMVLVLNKIDLVPKEIVSKWLTVLRRSHPTIAVKASKHSLFENENSNNNSNNNNNKDASTSSVPVGMEGLLQLLKNYARTGGSDKAKTTIVAGVIGYPNVGKSSIINALKRTRVVGVSSRPGFTTSAQEVVLDKTVRLLDSPGVVFDDDTALLGNCVDADSLGDPIPPVDALLRRCKPENLMMTYNIPAFPRGNTNIFLAMVAKSNGRILKGGIPDKVSAAKLVLKDWNTGKIPYYTIPPEDYEPDSNKGDARIVSEFGDDFFAKYDEKTIGTLKENDDGTFFVEMVVTGKNENDEDDETMTEGGGAGGGDDPIAKKSMELAKYLSSGSSKSNDDNNNNNKNDDDDDNESMEEEEDYDDDDDNDDDNMEDEDDDDDHEKTAASARRAELARAEDFDFKTMM